MLISYYFANAQTSNDMIYPSSSNRKSDALVIHCPAAPRQHKRFSLTRTSLTRTSLSRSQKSGRRSYLESGTWGSEIVDEVKPVESDIVLEKRTSLSALEGTNLSSIIKENGIQNVILLGFLSEGAVVETAVELSDEFPELNVIACRDGTASTKKNHTGAMKRVIIHLSCFFSVHIMMCLLPPYLMSDSSHVVYCDTCCLLIV